MNVSVLAMTVAVAFSMTAEEAAQYVTLPVTMPIEKAAECMDQTCIIVTEQEVREIFAAGHRAGAASCKRSVL